MNATATPNEHQPAARHSPMKTLQYRLTFLTPAFLGDAEQNARWRTPPLKHALREWWRVIFYAAHKQHHFSISDLRDAEGILWGHAWLPNDTFVEADGKTAVARARKSQVRLRLLSINDAADTQVLSWGGKRESGVAPLVDNLENSYAWFGLVRRGAGLADRNRLAASESRRLVLSCPSSYEKEIKSTIELINLFGTLGSRSQGGWGSVSVEPVRVLNSADLQSFCEPLERCLEKDWKAAIACDAGNGKPWVWRSRQAFRTWHEALAYGARCRRELRGALKAPRDHRAILGFASPGRMPSPLHWKVLSDEGGLRVQAAAFPHRVPAASGVQIQMKDMKAAWQKIAQMLDERMERLD